MSACNLDILCMECPGPLLVFLRVEMSGHSEVDACIWERRELDGFKRDLTYYTYTVEDQ